MIRFIFSSFENGKGKTDIAMELNWSNVITPTAYIEQVHGIFLWVKNYKFEET